MIRWTKWLIVTILVVLNGWLAFPSQSAAGYEHTKTCGCVYEGGPGGPSGPGMATCFNLPGDECTTHDNCPECPPE